MIAHIPKSSGVTLDRWAYLFDIKRDPREADETLRARIIRKHEVICKCTQMALKW